MLAISAVLSGSGCDISIRTVANIPRSFEPFLLPAVPPYWVSVRHRPLWHRLYRPARVAVRGQPVAVSREVVPEA